MRAEGRDLASERVVRQVDTQEIGDEPITSAHGWETSGDTTHQSERVAWLSVLGVVRQAVPPGRAGTCLRPLPCQRRGRRGGGAGDTAQRKGRGAATRRTCGP